MPVEETRFSIWSSDPKGQEGLGYNFHSGSVTEKVDSGWLSFVLMHSGEGWKIKNYITYTKSKTEMKINLFIKDYVQSNTANIREVRCIW